MGVEEVAIAPRSPWQNPLSFVGDELVCYLIRQLHNGLVSTATLKAAGYLELI
jgi:hypothetical protein